jgi:hypothetical protein
MYRVVIDLTVADPAADDIAVPLESTEFCVNHVGAYAMAEASGCIGNGDDDCVCRHRIGNGETIGVWTTVSPYGEINEQFVRE